MKHDLQRIESIDLNLLRVLHALLQQGSVTGAAQQLGRSPSAVSHALGRLRSELRDPLLVRSGNRLLPSPRAEALREPLARVLADLARVLASGSTFEPASATRTFTVAAPDVLGLLAPALLSSLHAEAPSVGLELIRPVSDAAIDSLGPGGADLLLAPAPTSGEGLMMRSVGRLEHAVLLRRDHPALRGQGILSAEDYASLAHVFVRTGTPGPSLVSHALEAAGFNRRVGITVSSFALAPIVVANTDLIFTTPEPLVRSLLDPLGLVVVPAPVSLPQVTVASVWHARNHEEIAHRWFRTRIMQVVGGWLR